MIESVPLSWLFAAIGLWFGVQAVRPNSNAATRSRVSHLAHAVMACVMSAMLWPAA
ncbi:hypothetical protein GCM10023322_07350 [Rugosimonospora acidiphila]|uniref:DUF5134 domain-containing protein n=1 Tax=Rugosimonospora acidiphila TaxID=556531 RepID=A0ABP9RJJ2_9ACTN